MTALVLSFARAAALLVQSASSKAAGGVAQQRVQAVKLPGGGLVEHVESTPRSAGRYARTAARMAPARHAARGATRAPPQGWPRNGGEAVRAPRPIRAAAAAALVVGQKLQHAHVEAQKARVVLQ